MSNVVIAINTYGVFTVASPFTIASGNYRCGSVQLISALVSSGVDVYNTYYAPNSISSAAFNTDLANGVTIVVLIPDSGATVSIPSSYITSAPTDLAVPYSKIVLSIDIGLLPDSLDLTQLMNDLSELAQTEMGITATTQLHKISSTVNYTVAQSQALETARLAAIESYVSNITAKNNALTELVACKQKVHDLELALINKP